MLVNRFQFVVFVGIIASLIYLAVPDQSDLGQMFFDSYKFERARDYLEHAISKDSNNIKSLKKMAAYHLVQGDNESAVVLYEHLSAIRPRNQKFIERLMLLYDWINKPYKKLKVSERKIELVPESERSALIRSIADGYRYLKKFADADRIFQLLHRLSDDEETLIYLANYYLSTGQIAPAVKVLEQIVRLPAPPTKYRKHLIEIYVFKKVYTKALVQMLLQYGVRNDVKGKIFHADFIKSSQPLTEQRNDRLDRFEQVYIDMKRLDVAIAIRDRRCLLLKKRKKVSCLIELANYYELAGDIRGEIAVLQRRERLVPKDWKRLRRIANKYEELNNIDNAILYFERVRRVVPKNKMNLWKLVGKYNEKSAHESVIARLWMLHDLYERPIKVLRQLADKYEETGKLKLAIKMHLRILELQEKKRVKKKSADAQPPYHRDFFAAMETAIATVSLKGMVIARASQLTAQDRTRIKLIALYEADNDSENAILLYQRLLIDYPRNLKWQIALSRHYLYTDRMDKSARQFAYVLRLDPDNTEALMVLYQYHVGRNAYRDALPFFEKYKRHILVKRENNFTVVDHMNQVEIYRAVSNEEQLTRSCDSVVHNYLSSWEKNKYLIYTILFCLKKQGQHDQRVQIMENFLHKNQKSDDIRSDIVDIKIDAMQLDDARRHLDYMELLGQYKDRNQKQRTYLKEIERDIEEVEKKRVVVDVVAEKGVGHTQVLLRSVLDSATYWRLLYGFRVDASVSKAASTSLSPMIGWRLKRPIYLRLYLPLVVKSAGIQPGLGMHVAASPNDHLYLSGETRFFDDPWQAPELSEAVLHRSQLYLENQYDRSWLYNFDVKVIKYKYSRHDGFIFQSQGGLRFRSAIHWLRIETGLSVTSSDFNEQRYRQFYPNFGIELTQYLGWEKKRGRLLFRVVPGTAIAWRDSSWYFDLVLKSHFSHALNDSKRMQLSVDADIGLNQGGRMSIRLGLKNAF